MLNLEKLFTRCLVSVLSISLLGSIASVVYASDDIESENSFINRMVSSHDFSVEELQTLFSNASKNQRIIDLMNSPAEGKPWHEYRKIFIREARIKAALEFWNKHQILLQKAEATFQVPAEVIVSIIGIETFYGRIQGNISVFDALYTLGFHYPKRATFFRSELEEYLLLAREQGWDPLEPVGSYAGAMGMGQFIPTSYREYAVDFDGDGKIDLFNNPADAIGSVANYFRVHKWRWNEPVAYPLTKVGKRLKEFKPKRFKPQSTAGTLRAAGYDWAVTTIDQQASSIVDFEQVDGDESWVIFDNFYVITRYNRSPLYAMAVHQFSLEVLARRAQAYWL